MNKMNKDIIILGDWHGTPIWRKKTPEEKLRDADIEVEDANLYIALNENEN